MQRRSTASRILILAVLVAAAVVLFLVLRDDDSGESTATPQPPARVITIRGGKPVGGVQQLQAKKGGRVGFQIKSDVADEVHIHGYDLKIDVPAGGTASFDFPATIDGVFEVELEQRHEQIAELTVQP